MKKVLAVVLGLLLFSGSMFAKGFDKAVGVDFSFNGITPNFYMINNHFEFQTGLSYMYNSKIFTSQAILPCACIGYTTEIFGSNTRFAIGLDDTIVVGFRSDAFSTGNLFSIYMRLSKPLDSKLELGGKLYIPMHFVNVSTDPNEFVNLLPCKELLQYGFSLFTFEVRYYLGGL